MSYLSDNGRFGCEGIEIRNAISYPNEPREGLYEVQHLISRKADRIIPILLTCIGTALLLAVIGYQIWGAV
jgi:hypothetical protein